MKKYLFVLAASLMTAACTTTTKTARTESVPYSMYNATEADLDVAPQRITYTLMPTKAIRRGGLENCKNAAVQEALAANGNADLLLEPQFVVKRYRNLVANFVTSVTVTGYPATYKNIRSLGDEVWTNAAFRNFTGGGHHIFQVNEK